MIFHRARLKQTKIELNLGNISIKRISFTKFLGVIIDEKLSFTRHISYIKNKISKAMGIIIKARKYLYRKSLLNLYHAFVFPYLTYCMEFWGNASEVYLDALLKVQKKLFESLPISYYLAHTDDFFKQLNILLVYKLKFQRICLQMCKYANNTLPGAISKLFISNTAYHSYNTRNKQNLRPKVSKRAYKNFSFIGAQIWNDVHKHINVSMSFSSFKKSTRT